MDKRIDLGPCCACGKDDETVRNIYVLDRLAPVPGTGWGCVVCGLPPDGACAAICDECHEKKAELKWVQAGYATDKARILIRELPEEPFEHRMEFHPEETGRRAGLDLRK